MELLERTQNSMRVAQQHLDELAQEVHKRHPLVGGGRAKHVKVGMATVGGVVTQLFANDLQVVNDAATGRFLDHIVSTDAKLARSAYQAKNRHQRLLALAAACHRAGLSDHELRF
eukprot:2358844-Amphidinium_carterae.1